MFYRKQSEGEAKLVSSSANERPADVIDARARKKKSPQNVSVFKSRRKSGRYARTRNKTRTYDKDTLSNHILFSQTEVEAGLNGLTVLPLCGCLCESVCLCFSPQRET